MTENNAAQPVLTDHERNAVYEAWLAVQDGEFRNYSALMEAIESALLSKLRAEGVQAGDERAALTRQDIYDRFQFLEGLVNEQRYKQIAETAIAIYESGAPWSDMAQTIRDLHAELGYVAQYGKRVLPDMCPPATSRDRWMYEQGRLAERASAPVAGGSPIYLDAGHLREVRAGNDMPVSASTEPGHGMVPYYAAPQASTVAGEAVAWMHAEDPARVVSALQKATSERDGGAYASSLRPYTIPLGRLAAPQASKKPHEVAALVNKLRDIANQYHDSQQLRERIAQEIRPLFAPQASEAVRAVETAKGEGDVELCGLPIKHEWASLISDSFAKALRDWAHAYARASVLAESQQHVGDADDAARWRWATTVDENAETLHSIVVCHGGDQQKINERADFYRAALSAQPGAQRTGGSDAE